MAIEIVMPQLSDTMEEGRIIKWLKNVGDMVKEGEPLLEIETDKADIEVESFDTGVLVEIVADEGETVQVGEKIGILYSDVEPKAPAEPAPEKPEKPEKEEIKEAPEAREPEKPTEEVVEEKIEEPLKATPAPAPVEIRPRPAQPEVSVHMETREALEKFVARRAPGKVTASPLARELAKEHGVDLSEVKGTGASGEIVKRDVEQVVAGKKEGKAPKPVEKPGKEENATPLAAVLAEKEGIDLDEVRGTGLNGRIREIDVKAYAAKRCELRGEELQELSLMRKTIARRMTESKQTIPHFYLTMPIDMGAAMELRKKLNEDKGDTEKISVNDVIIKAAALALEEIPEVNAAFVDDKIKINKRVNIGVATATPDGLIVPVVFDSSQKAVADIAAETKDKAERAKKRKLKPDEYSNATFTVSNLGMFGIEHFTAIIDPGQSAILAVGAVAAEPIIDNGEVKTRHTMRVTLSCDHRVIDGYTGAQFLIQFRSILESPAEAIR